MNTALNQAASEPQRAIASSMNELASTCGDLESEVRRLAARIAPTIPGGSPFDAEKRPLSTAGGTLGAPTPMRSHLNDELQTRIEQLRTLAGTLSGISERIEL